MASNYEFNLPDIGEGVTEGEIVQWLVSEGAEVAEDEAIVEIMTDKATVEIASPVAGILEKKGCEEGDMLKVGSLLAAIKTDDSKSSEQASESSSPEQNPSPAAKTPQESESPQGSEASQSSNIISMPNSESSTQSQSKEYVLASPATRKLARERGLALNQIPASGPSGRLLKADVESFQPGQVTEEKAQEAEIKSLPQKSISGATEEERIPLKGIRKIIATNMMQSVRTAAHFTHVDEFDATELVKAREALKKDAEAYGVKLTYLPFIVKALCRALMEFPKLNASLDDEKQEMVIKKYYNIGIAVATKDDDLIVPVLKHADQKGLLEIASEISELAERARHNKLSPDQLKGGTFTITSMGKFGGIAATPIINHPEVGILGIQKIEDRVVVRKGEMVIRKMANASLSCDHRMVDGYLGAQFLVRLFEFLEQPSRMML